MFRERERIDDVHSCLARWTILIMTSNVCAFLSKSNYVTIKNKQTLLYTTCIFSTIINKCVLIPCVFCLSVVNLSGFVAFVACAPHPCSSCHTGLLHSLVFCSWSFLSLLSVHWIQLCYELCVLHLAAFELN